MINFEYIRHDNGATGRAVNYYDGDLKRIQFKKVDWDSELFDHCEDLGFGCTFVEACYETPLDKADCTFVTQEDLCVLWSLRKNMPTEQGRKKTLVIYMEMKRRQYKEEGKKKEARQEQAIIDEEAALLKSKSDLDNRLLWEKKVVLEKTDDDLETIDLQLSFMRTNKKRNVSHSQSTKKSKSERRASSVEKKKEKQRQVDQCQPQYFFFLCIAFFAFVAIIACAATSAGLFPSTVGLSQCNGSIRYVRSLLLHVGGTLLYMLVVLVVYLPVPTTL